MRKTKLKGSDEIKIILRQNRKNLNTKDSSAHLGLLPPLLVCIVHLYYALTTHSQLQKYLLNRKDPLFFWCGLRPSLVDNIPFSIL